MKHHGGKLGRGKVNLKEVQAKIAGVTASHDKALTKMAGKGNVLKGKNNEGKKGKSYSKVWRMVKGKYEQMN